MRLSVLTRKYLDKKASIYRLKGITCRKCFNERGLCEGMQSVEHDQKVYEVPK